MKDKQPKLVKEDPRVISTQGQKEAKPLPIKSPARDIQRFDRKK